MKKRIKKSIRRISAFIIPLFPYKTVPAGLLRQFMIRCIEKRDFKKVKEYCINMSDTAGVKDRVKKTAAYFFCKVHPDNNPDPEVLRKLQTLSQKTAHDAVELLKRGKTEKASEAFGKYIKEAVDNKKAQVLWLDSFERLACFSVSKNSGFLEKISLSKEEEFSPEKILVSGMLWSGSGALYDFFREFDGVRALRNEQRLWKGKPFGLNSLANYLVNKDEYKKALFSFFTVALTGMKPPGNWQETLASEIASEFMQKDFDGKYAEAGTYLIEKLAGMLNVRDYDYFLKAASVFTDKMLNGVMGAGSGPVLIDNPVHAGNIEAFNLFNNAVLFCVFRDPRSNYVSRYYENPRFNRDPEGFVEYYRKTMTRFEERLKNRVRNPEKVIKVQFEEFILSEDYRRSLAVKAGLNLTAQKSGKHFKPHISAKNVFNYKIFFDQDIIKTIEEELNEYCLE